MILIRMGNKRAEEEEEAKGEIRDNKRVLKRKE